MCKALAILFLVLLISISGCVDSSEYSIKVREPAPGDRFVYEGSDGSTITATIGGHAVRTDGMQRLRDVLLIQYAITAANFPDFRVLVEEAIDVDTKLHVRHDVLCDVQGSPEDSRCEADLNEIFFMTDGFSGALGLATFWGEEITEGKIKIPSNSPTSTGALDAQAKGIEVDGRRCIDLQIDEADRKLVGAWMPVTSGVSPRLICDGDILPSAWVPDRAMPITFSHVPKPIFRLVETGKATEGRDASDSQVRPILGRERVSGSLALLNHAETAGGLDAVTAHGIAMREDSGYAEFFNADASAFVVRAEFAGGGGALAVFGAISEESSQWTLTLAHLDGSGYRATIQRVQRSTAWGDENTSHRVTESGPLAKKVDVPHAAPDLEGISPDVSYDYGRDLFGADPDGAYHVFEHRSRIGAPKAPLDDRFITRTFYVPPEDKGPCHGSCITRPWIVDTDSLSGSVTYVRMPSELRLSA